VYIFDNQFVADLGTSVTNLTLAVTNAQMVNGSDRVTLVCIRSCID
jgi:hypothetical protein